MEIIIFVDTRVCQTTNCKHVFYRNNKNEMEKDEYGVKCKILVDKNQCEGDYNNFACILPEDCPNKTLHILSDNARYKYHNELEKCDYEKCGKCQNCPPEMRDKEEVKKDEEKKEEKIK